MPRRTADNAVMVILSLRNRYPDAIPKEVLRSQVSLLIGARKDTVERNLKAMEQFRFIQDVGPAWKIDWNRVAEFQLY